MGGSHVTLATCGNRARKSRARMNYSMAALEAHFVFSAKEKFIEFCGRVFSGKSRMDDYKEIYQLFCYDKPCSLWNETLESHWRPLLGLMKMMDHSKVEYRQHYHIVWQINGNDSYMLTLLYADKPLARTILNQQETDFLKSRVFNENNGEIILCAAPERTDPRQEYYTSALLKHYEQYRQTRDKAKSAPASATPVSNSAALTSYAFPTGTACALSAGDTHSIAAIDRFLARIAGKPIEQQVIAKGKEIGQGSYGSAYRIGAFVVKIPRNKDSVWINFAGMPNAHPIRVQHYLNKANNQPDFARAGVMSDKHGDPVDVLVTKYIAGSTLEDLSDEEKGNVLRTKALLLLDSCGLYMHDAEVVGNILIQSDGRIYFIDADQVVIAQRQRLARTPSFATDVLEDALERYYQIMTKLALKRDRRDDEYRTRLSALRAIRGRSVAHE